jgi:hypothetical protein
VLLLGVLFGGLGAGKPGQNSVETIVSALSYCIVCFVAAAILGMLGSVGLAVRDMARNSFR